MRLRFPVRAVAMVLLCATGCATPKGDSHLVERLRPALPSLLPQPLPLGETGAVDITQDTLSDAQARTLGPKCMQAIQRHTHGTPGASAPVLRVVVSHITVDVSETAKGQRAVQAVTVAELRASGRPLAIAAGRSTLVNGAPSLGNGAMVQDVERTVEDACRQAVLALLAPPQPLPPTRRGELLAQAASPEAPVRAAALQELGAQLDERDAPVFAAALEDAAPSVRRMGAWGLGQLAASSAVPLLASLAELDADYAVRVECVSSLNRLIAVDPSLRPAIRDTRAAALAQRLAREAAEQAAPAATDEPAESDVPSRVLEE